MARVRPVTAAAVAAGSMHQVAGWQSTKTGRAPTLETTPGRILFNRILPDEVGYVNQPLGKKQLAKVVADAALTEPSGAPEATLSAAAKVPPPEMPVQPIRLGSTSGREHR